MRIRVLPVALSAALFACGLMTVQAPANAAEQNANQGTLFVVDASDEDAGLSCYFSLNYLHTSTAQDGTGDKVVHSKLDIDCTGTNFDRPQLATIDYTITVAGPGVMRQINNSIDVSVTSDLTVYVPPSYIKLISKPGTWSTRGSILLKPRGGWTAEDSDADGAQLPYRTKLIL